MSNERKERARIPPRWFVRLFWSTHRGLYRLTGGRFGLRRAKPSRWGMMHLTTTGRRTGSLFSDRFGDSPVPVGILIPPDGRHAYVANTNADIITVIDLKTFEIIDRLVGGKEPDGLGWTPLDLNP